MKDCLYGLTLGVVFMAAFVFGFKVYENYVVTVKTKPSLEVKWFNDGVYYSTNGVSDDERNRNIPLGSTAWYVKEVVTTNKTTQFYFPRDNRQIELGSRSDGVVVWRYLP